MTHFIILTILEIKGFSKVKVSRSLVYSHKKTKVLTGLKISEFSSKARSLTSWTLSQVLGNSFLHSSQLKTLSLLLPVLSSVIVRKRLKSVSIFLAQMD